MHPNQFDRLVRTLSTTQTRRGTFTALARATAGTTLATLFAVPGHEEAAASCRAIGEGCTRTRQCCGHKKKKWICGLQPPDRSWTELLYPGKEALHLHRPVLRLR